MSFAIHHGNSIDVLKGFEQNTFDCCVTSPPYWGLRSYGTPHQVWGGVPGCAHEWGNEQLRGGPGGGNGSTSAVAGRAAFEQGIRKNRGRSEGRWCQICNAWRGELGSEPTPELFVSHLVGVFREVRRVISGTLWLNIGDSWCTKPHGYLGTVGNACLKHGRDFVGVELNPDYIQMANNRVQRTAPLLAGAV